MPKIAGLLPAGTKIRLHVTQNDCTLGCSAPNPSRNCAVARPVSRAIQKGSGLSFGVGFSTIDLYKGRWHQELVAVDRDRMSEFTRGNDSGFVQTPTSFTFVALSPEVS